MKKLLGKYPRLKKEREMFFFLFKETQTAIVCGDKDCRKNCAVVGTLFLFILLVTVNNSNLDNTCIII
jgi:hypothetical protein